MAEAVALTTSILSVADTNIKLGVSLWRIGKLLKDAGNDARTISRKVRLIGDTLKQIASKLRHGIRPRDICLVEDIVSLCEERLLEIEQLVNVLKKTTTKGWTSMGSLLGKIRFVFDRSKFATLQNDLDSLLITLQLVVGVLSYEENCLSRQLTEEVKENLNFLKEVVEQDLLWRDMQQTVQHMSTLNTGHQTRESALDYSDSVDSQVRVVKDSIQPRGLNKETNKQLVVATDLDEEVNNADDALGQMTTELSRAIFVFAKTQIVQERAVRQADEKISHNTNISTFLDDNDRTEEVASIASEDFIDPDVNAISTPNPTTTSELNQPSSPTAACIANRYEGHVFKLCDIQGREIWLSMENLLKKDLCELVEEWNKPLLGYEAPSAEPNDPYSGTSPPTSSWRRRLSTSTALNQQSQQPNVQHDKPFDEKNIVAYAAWYTAQYIWNAIQRKHYYFIYTVPSDGDSGSGPTLSSQRMPVDTWTEWLTPGCTVRISFFSDLLKPQHMLWRQNTMLFPDFNPYAFIDHHSYKADLEKLLYKHRHDRTMLDPDHFYVGFPFGKLKR